MLSWRMQKINAPKDTQKGFSRTKRLGVIGLRREAVFCFSNKRKRKTLIKKLSSVEIFSALISAWRCSFPWRSLDPAEDSRSTRHYSSLRTTAKSSSRSLISAEERRCSTSHTAAGGHLSRTCAHYRKDWNDRPRLCLLAHCTATSVAREAAPARNTESR